MKEKIKIQKGFIQIPLLIAIIVSLVVISVGAYGGFEYYKTSKLVKEADQFTKEEKYDEAIGKLNLAQVSWFVKSLGIKKQEITNKQEEVKKLVEDLSKYNQGLDNLDKGNYQEAIDSFSEIPENSFYYKDAQLKTEEAKRKILEQQQLETQKEMIRIEKGKLNLMTQQLEMEKEKQIREELRESEMRVKLNDCLTKEKRRYQAVWDNYLKEDAPLKVSGSDWYELWKMNEEKHDEEIARCYQLYSSK